MILAIFDLQVTPMLSTKSGVNWPFGSGEEAKNTIRTTLAIFVLQVTPMLAIKY